jgi:hypothetical protein
VSILARDRVMIACFLMVFIASVSPVCTFAPFEGGFVGRSFNGPSEVRAAPDGGNTVSYLFRLAAGMIVCGKPPDRGIPNAQ